MNYKNIMNEIYALMESPCDCSDMVAQLLYKNKCLFMLSRITNKNEKYTHCLDTNHLIQQYRYLYCENVFKELDNIQYAILKGPVLSNSIYGKPFYRLSGDIDILISPSNLEQVTKILIDNGFTQGKVVYENIIASSRRKKVYHKLYTHQLSSFHKKSNFLLSPIVTIDINFDILWGESEQKISIEEFLMHTENVIVFDVNIKKLSPIYEFISMCLHHYKDMNSIYLLFERGYYLYEFFDIYYYLVNSKLNANDLYNISLRYNVVQYVYYCIYYTNELFHDKRLQIYLDTLETPEGINLLEHFGLNDKEKHLWKIPFIDRVIGIDFKTQFKGHLNDEDLRKIEINSNYMLGD